MEVRDPTNSDAMRAKVESSSIREQCVQAHAVSGELVPNDKVHHTEPCSNGVSKDGSDQSAVLPEEKPSYVQPQGACQGAMTSEKNVPDYFLFPLSRGFCLSLVRAFDSFEATLERINCQTALSRFQRSAIGSCIALIVIKSNTQIRWKYFKSIYLFFRLSDYKEIEFSIKCC